MGKNLNFKNSDSLDMVRTLLDEAELSLDDETRTTNDVQGQLGDIMNDLLKLTSSALVQQEPVWLPAESLESDFSAHWELQV